MILKLHRDFLKQYRRLSKNEKKKFKERRTLFMQDEFDPILNNHSLKGKYLGYRSVNVTGDLRAIFIKNGDEVIFVAIGSHNKLYG